jgi:deazaflavin-dependent oxidoreductase (nitroreductase family)
MEDERWPSLDVSRILAKRRCDMTQQNLPVDVVPHTKTGKGEGKAPSFLIPIFKMPVLLYRMHLGWLMGKRFMQLTHIGRRSGKVRRTILAVLKFDEKTREIYAISAWKGSDWYYNIQAAPAVQVETVFVHYVPDQRTLTPEEITMTFIEYRGKHPIFSRMVCRIPGWKWDSTYDEFHILARTLRGVAFRPK